jgi:hypothetical protein
MTDTQVTWFRDSDDIKPIRAAAVRHSTALEQTIGRMKRVRL